MTVTLSLDSLLRENGITPYRVARELKGKLHMNTVYKVTSPDGVVRLDLETLGLIVNVVSALLGRPVRADELLRVVPEPHELKRSKSGHHYTGHEATDEILDEVPDLDERLAQVSAYLAGEGGGVSG